MTKTTKKKKKKIKKTEFPKDKKGELTVRLLVAVASDGEHAVEILSSRDNLAVMINEAVFEVENPGALVSVDVYLLEQAFVLPKPRHLHGAGPKVTKLQRPKDPDGE